MVDNDQDHSSMNRPNNDLPSDSPSPTSSSAQENDDKVPTPSSSWTSPPVDTKKDSIGVSAGKTEENESKPLPLKDMEQPETETNELPFDDDDDHDDDQEMDPVVESNPESIDDNHRNAIEKNHPKEEEDDLLSKLASMVWTRLLELQGSWSEDPRVMACLVAVLSWSVGTSWGRAVWHQVGLFLLRCLAWALGSALGLGWSAHVYEQLDVWYTQQQEQELQRQQHEQQLEQQHQHSLSHHAGTTILISGDTPPTQGRPRLDSSSSFGPSSSSFSHSVNDPHHSHGSTTTNIPRPLVSHSTGPSATTTSMSLSSALPPLQEEQTYTSLMQAAGYSVWMHNHNQQPQQGESSTATTSTAWLRGQVWRSSASQSSSSSSQGGEDRYRLEHGTRALETMTQVWGPSSPHPRIQQALAQWMEYLLRDFVVSWYSLVDAGVAASQATAAAAPPEDNTGGEDTDNDKSSSPATNDPNAAPLEPTTTNDTGDDDNDDVKTALDPTQRKQDDTNREVPSPTTTQQHTTASVPPMPPTTRSMIYSTARHRSIPFLDQLYSSMGILFGNLALRVESVNVLELVLLKWTRIIAHTFRVYRQLRRRVLQQTPASHHHNSQSASTRRSTASARSTTTTTNPTSPSTTSPSTNNNSGERSPQPALASSTASSSARRSTTSTTSGGGPSHHHKKPRRLKRPITEMTMTREFLLAGKLHRAITFGLDVPSLLFADASGRECGILDPNSSNSQQDSTAAARPPTTSTMTPDQVLEHRLFQTPLLRECELDYNRVLAHRMIRALASRTDSASPVLSALLTELFASTVLTSTMSLFGPDTLNGWILQALATDSTTASNSTNSTKDNAKSDATTTTDKTSKPTTAKGTATAGPRKSQSTSALTTASPRKHSLTTHNKGMGHSLSAVQEETVLDETTDDDKIHDNARYTSHASSLALSSSSSFPDSMDTTVEDHGNDDDVTDPILIALRQSLLEMRNYMDFDQLRARSLSPRSSSSLLHTTTEGIVDTVEWDDPDCRAAVLKLVLVLEATLCHGRANNKNKNKKAAVTRPVRTHSEDMAYNNNGDEDDPLDPQNNNISSNSNHSTEFAKERDESGREEEDEDDDHDDTHRSEEQDMNRTRSLTTDSQIDDSLADDPAMLATEYREEVEASVTLPQLLMEMTGDIDAFEERVASENSVLMAQESVAEGYYSTKQGNEEDGDDDHELHHHVLPPTEQSTLRTLIAAWLHTGQIHRIMTLIVQAHATILAPYYHKSAFLRSLSKTSRLVRHLQVLDQVDVLVDTMEVLASRQWDIPIHHVRKKKAPKKIPPPVIMSSMTTTTSVSTHEDTDDEATLVTTDSTRTINVSDHGDSIISSSHTLEAQAQQQAQSTSASMQASQLLLSSATVPRHFDYHRNEAFAASLRSERERRMQSWYAYSNMDLHKSPSMEDELSSMFVSRTTRNEAETQRHKELHQIARIFYNGTNLISIRDAARRKNAPPLTIPMSPMDNANNNTQETSSPEQQSQTPTDPVQDRAEESSIQAQQASSEEEDLVWVSLLTVETVCGRRRIEVPDDDSSFLLRAQPRPLHAVGVHRDQRNHDQSFKCFAASYEEPALGSDHYAGGRYIRMCLVRYYPIDRTAAIFPPQQQDVRNKLDQRKIGNVNTVPELITLDVSSPASNRPQPAPVLSSDFLRERHICHRWIPRGTSRTHSMLASNVMEPSDFTAQPRTGKAIDFVYRMSLYEKPMIELRNKKFTVNDSLAARNTHRADASSMEISDATLSAALYVLGESTTSLAVEEGGSTLGSNVQMGEDGYPIIWMKFNRQTRDSQIEVKPYRLSFVRAALLVTEARQEAQLQSLIACVKIGSAKNATKALTDARLKPSLRLLYHASHKSREKQSLLLRDLKLGINHVDREQLRRNGLLNPRYPTQIQDLSVYVEDALFAEDVHDANLFGTTGTVYKIKCKAVIELIHDDNDPVDQECYGKHTGSFSEEWVVYRSFKEFQTLHRHLKAMVSSSESSGNAVTRLSASIHGATNPSSIPKRHRGALVPSLSQASKIGTLGLTKKSMQKRKEHLEGYLSYLFAPNHLLNRCPELLLFVGAFYPLPPAVKLDVCVTGLPDPLGRTRMKRKIIEEEKPVITEPSLEVVLGATGLGTKLSNSDDAEGIGEEKVETKVRKPRRKTVIYMIPAIRHKIDKVPLSQVRNRIFELFRYQFGFDNASFMRNRMLAGLKTASFAVTSASDFRRLLYTWHTTNLSTSAVAGWIDFGLDLIWPNGVFFQAAPPLTPEQLVDQAKKSKQALHQAFPDAVRALLGQELTRDGLNIVHEMLQNRLVVKSMAYMLFDLLWLEVFPEIGDVLQGGAALDIDK